MSEKHTPGPWKHGGIYVTSNGVPDRFVRASSGIVAYCEGPIDEARANARLIAAAPDLLEALQGLPSDDADMIVHNPEEGAYFFCCGVETYALIGKMQHAPGCWYVKLRAAIAKATGGAEYGHHVCACCGSPCTDRYTAEDGTVLCCECAA